MHAATMHWRLRMTVRALLLRNLYILSGILFWIHVCSCDATWRKYDRTDNTRLTVIYDQIQQDTASACCIKCHSSSICKSVNYNTGSKQCQFSSINMTDVGSDIENSAEWATFTKKEPLPLQEAPSTTPTPSTISTSYSTPTTITSSSTTSTTTSEISTTPTTASTTTTTSTTSTKPTTTSTTTTTTTPTTTTTSTTSTKPTTTSTTTTTPTTSTTTTTTSTTTTTPITTSTTVTTTANSDCPVPLTVDFGSFSPSIHSAPDGTIVTYSCNSGYTSTTSVSKMTSVCLIGTWSALSFDCRKDCVAPPTVAFATIPQLIGSYQEGDYVTFACNPGYVSNVTGYENMRSTCQPTGQWTDPIFECLTVCSGFPPSTAYASYDPQILTGFEGQTVTYTCQPGTDPYPNGPDVTSICQDSGDWSALQFICDDRQSTHNRWPTTAIDFHTELMVVLRCYSLLCHL